MKQLVTITFILLFVSVGLKAQQEAQFTQYMFNHMSINAGYAGVGKENQEICANMFARHQWLGFKDNDNAVHPQTYLLSVHSRLNKLYGGIGLTVHSDKIGYFNNVGVKLAYSYHYYSPFDLPGVLGIGLDVGILNQQLDYGKFVPIETTDPKLQGGEESTMAFDMGFGLYYKLPGTMYAAISSTQLLQMQGDLPSPLEAPKLKRHYFITGGYEYTIPSYPSVVLKPSLFIKTDFASAQYDIACLAEYNNIYWGGLSYRVQDAVALIVGAKPFYNSASKELPPLIVGYSYDFTTSAIGRNGRSSGSHEIMLGYCFQVDIPKPPPTGYKNVRFL